MLEEAQPIYQDAPDRLTAYPAYSFKVKGRSLASMDGLGKKSDPYFVLSTQINGKELIIYRSEIVKDDLDPMFKPFEVQFPPGVDRFHALHFDFWVCDS
jgi:hypothetical protein